MSTNIYNIKAGDTLTKIARMYNTTIAKLAELNNIENVDLIFAGADLKIPTDSFEKTSSNDQTLNGNENEEIVILEEELVIQEEIKEEEEKKGNEEIVEDEEIEEQLTEEEKQAYLAFAGAINTDIQLSTNTMFGNPNNNTENEEIIEEETDTITSTLDLSGYADDIVLTENVQQASMAGNIALVGAGATTVLGLRPYANSLCSSISEFSSSRAAFTTTRTTQRTLVGNAQQELVRRQNAAARLQRSAKTAAKNAKNAPRAVAQATTAASKEIAAAEAALNKAVASGNSAEIKAAKQAYQNALQKTSADVGKVADKAAKSTKTAETLGKSARTAKTNAKAAKTAVKTAKKTAAKATTKAAGKVVQSGTKVVGKAALPLAVAAEGYALYSAYNEGEEAFKEQSKKTAVVASCAAVGAGVGVWFFGVGAAPGAGVGALVGEVITWFM